MKKKKRKSTKKNKKNQKGFSMVEVLAVVVILGVLSTIGIVSVSRMIENSRRHYYQSQVDQMVLAAQSYANDNKNVLPKTIGETKTIYLQELIDNKYIDEIVDQNKNKCYTEDQYDNGKKVKGSRVDIYKSSKSDYKYVGYLECKACQKDNAKDEDYSCSTKNDEDKPKITIGMKKYDATSDGNSIFNDSNKITITMDAVKKDPNGYNETIKISSYSYKIYVDGTVRFNSGLKINNKKDQIKIEDQLNKYIPGKVTVKVTATNTLGQTVTKSKSEDYRDAKIPACSNVTYEGPNKMKNYEYSTNIDTLKCGTPIDYKWVGLNTEPSSIQAWVLCNDELGVGCAQHEYSVNMVNEGIKEDIKMKDKEGNERTCTIKKCIDKTTPKIEVKVKNGSTVKYTYTKEPSKTDGKYKTNDKNEVWLNKENFPNGVTVEVTVSDSLSNLKTYTWKQNDKEKKENQEGNADNLIETKSWAWNADQDKYTKSINITEDGVRKEVISATDQAGNIHTYTLILKIDRTPPQKPNISMYREESTSGTSTGTPYPNNTWKSKYVWTTTNQPRDIPDVSGWKTNRYKITGAEANVSNIVGNSRNVNAEGTSTITYQSCDNADNCSAYVSPANKVLLDRSNPTCEVKDTGGTKGDNGWYKGGTVTATGHCTDQANLSGCKEAKTVVQVVNTNSATSAGTKNTITIYDNTLENKTTCTSTIKYDKTAPTCSIASHTWKVGSVPIKFTCSDSGPSGLASCPNDYDTSTTGTHSKTAKDKAGNTYTCSKTVSSQRQKNTCTSCSSGSCSGSCASYNKYCCQYVYEYCSTGGGICGGGRTCNSDDGHDCSPPGASNVQCNKKCNGSCASWNPSCSKCGCSTWGGWTTVSSCSESSTTTSKIDCRTRYKVG